MQKNKFEVKGDKVLITSSEEKGHDECRHILNQLNMKKRSLQQTITNIKDKILEIEKDKDAFVEDFIKQSRSSVEGFEKRIETISKDAENLGKAIEEIKPEPVDVEKEKNEIKKTNDSDSE